MEERKMNHEEKIKKQIDQVFEDARDQAEALIGIYKLFMPDYGEIEHISGFPRHGKKLSEYLWDKFIAFDQEHHPDVMAGGAWMNSGFSTDATMMPWDFDASNCEISYINKVVNG
jgi:hypothetical protein